MDYEQVSFEPLGAFSSEINHIDAFAHSEFFDKIRFLPQESNDISEWSNELDRGVRETVDILSHLTTIDNGHNTNIQHTHTGHQRKDSTSSHLQFDFTLSDGDLLDDLLTVPSSEPIVSIPVFDNRIGTNTQPNIMKKPKRNRSLSESDLLNFDGTDLTDFDITEYVFQDNVKAPTVKSNDIEASAAIKDTKCDLGAQPMVEKRSVRAGVKKIDMKARKYIVDMEDEDDVDIEALSEEENSPVIEAGDLRSLLEQFEATEVKNNNTNRQEEEILNSFKKEKKTNIENVISCSKQPSMISNVKIKKEKEIFKEELMDVKPKTKIKENENDSKRKLASIGQVKKEIESKIKTEPPEIPDENLTPDIRIPKIVRLVEATTSTSATDTTLQKYKSSRNSTMNTLESVRRKIITTDPEPLCNRKSRLCPVSVTMKTAQNVIQLDHNYCSPHSSPKIPMTKRDSGFASAEENEPPVVGRQPTVKNADGTLMVSLLKTNTIHEVDDAVNNKKKLNFEEYKKRRKDLISKMNSKTRSPAKKRVSSSSENDLQQRIMEHQQKLRKMAEELLNTAPKSGGQDIQTKPLLKCLPMSWTNSPEASFSSGCSSTMVSPRSDATVNTHTAVEMPNPPPHLERKIYVNFGVNTDCRLSKGKDPLEPVTKLQEIKPLLEKASDRINGNSLISSVIENIPKVLSKNGHNQNVNAPVQTCEYEHGEGKRIVYLEKDRPPCDTRDVNVQTRISFVGQRQYYYWHRRKSSCDSVQSCQSEDSPTSKRNRHWSLSSSSSRGSLLSPRSSSSSRSSHCSSRLSYSRSRSRSRSPRRQKRNYNINDDRDHLKAVEERRILYLGRITRGTTKDDLRRKFQKFGPIINTSLHFRDFGENYGFVTFKYKQDAHEAYEHGNDDPSFPYYKICFGGRRQFCKTSYSDLDNVENHSVSKDQAKDVPYDKLLKEAMETLRKKRKA